MPPEELTLILKLRDEATKQLKSVRGTVTAVGGAMAATGLKVGADWAAATKTIVDGTGATGLPLKTTPDRLPGGSPSRSRRSGYGHRRPQHALGADRA